MTEFNDDDDDVSFLIPPTKKEEKMWCQINDKNELNFVDWAIVKTLAEEFNALAHDKRQQHHLVAKLMWCVREQTLKECGRDTD